MKVLMALSGGVDSSVAAAELLGDGHEVVGITMRLWGGSSDTGCCSVADVDDARRVAQQLGIDHLVFNFTDDFDEHVVAPYVAAHQQGLTPNPCIECNRHLKFHRLSERADLLGFDAVATGHHARIVQHGGVRFVARGEDMAKDQSYVVHMLPQRELARTLFPIGHLAKAEVRRRATELGLRTAAKPDSQDVCFITRAEGREAFLKERMALHPGTIVDVDGMTVGHTSAVELVTIGQRKGLGLAGGADRRFVLDVDVAARTVTVGPPERLLVDALVVESLRWAGAMSASALDGTEVWVQCSAHASPYAATLERVAEASRSMCSGRGDSPHEVEVVLRWHEPQRRVASGQSVVLYDRSGPDASVLAGGLAR